MRFPVAAVLLFTAVQAQSLDRPQLEAFVDGVVVAAMEDHRIPGVVVSIVQAGEIVLEKGYGFAREPERVAADPRTSLFRVASISKTVNATALMQLVEQGRVDLDADFTTYLRGIAFNLPFGKVRVRDLLTHSAGFEDGYIGHFWAVDEASDLKLEETVARFQPAQVRPPGERLVYSNYGTSVIGLIIQRVSGLPYAEYMQKHVLQPLGMTRSGFRDAKTPDGERALAHSYGWTGGRYRRPGWAWMHAGWQPAGGLLATAHEMTLFMRAHLGDGAGVLKPETLEQMHRPLLGNHPFVNPNAHGFWVSNPWGYAALQHGGSIFGFMSNLVLVPELKLGIFISTNAGAGARLSGTLPRRILGRFFPKRLEIPAADPKANLAEFAGSYRPQRRSYSTVEKGNSLLNVLTVSANDQGYLALASGATTSRFVPLGGDRFVNADTGERLAFTRDAAQRPVLMHNDYGHNNYERVGLFTRAGFVFTVAGFLGFAIVARLMALWLYRKERPVESGWERIARQGTTAVAPVWLLFAYAVNKDFSAAEAVTAPHMAHYPTPWAWVWIVGGLVGAALTAGLAAGLVPVWWRRSWSMPRRLAYSGYVLACVAFVATIHHWNLLGLHMLG
ncbi:MAG: beta-lactamase family protein [Verrucomicrobia bacterium]|nr:beta-lactamase family protein [Verrucomicrobiota bacterium]